MYRRAAAGWSFTEWRDAATVEVLEGVALPLAEVYADLG